MANSAAVRPGVGLMGLRDGRRLGYRIGRDSARKDAMTQYAMTKFTALRFAPDPNENVKFGDARVDGLDVDARVNIPRQMREYWAYKASLIADGDSAEDAEMILRGYIWSELESEAAPD